MMATFLQQLILDSFYTNLAKKNQSGEKSNFITSQHLMFLLVDKGTHGKSSEWTIQNAIFGASVRTREAMEEYITPI